MGLALRQATAGQARAVGPFVSSTDFITVQTGLTIANTDVKLILNGGASANKNSGGGTHRANGVYGITFDATDTASLGELEVSILISGATVVFDKFEVLEEAVYDALYASGAGLALSDLYHADIGFSRDQTNTKDEYTVTWFKNGVRITSGVTSPTIQVVSRTAGADLIASTAMTEIGTTESFKYDATGASRITVGEAVVAIVAGTIDGSARSFAKVIGRDSA